ncbi:hypothetical protein BD410DRAFT_809691 [Rickenella mellea]|uniref:Hydrophobin n=1 Tax=Rickenella mellea TaxID=50990 RepID=A0A4Y7PHK2_9AGAM|nr:hypothetical protein BD410DRAFT_809691 [Rickenella mellea]
MQFTKGLTIVFVYLATGAFAQSCNQGGTPYSCSDASIACLSVQTGDITLGGQTAKQIGGFQTAAVFLTRAISSATRGNMQQLCMDLVNSCCNHGSGFGSKSTIAIQSDEQGKMSNCVERRQGSHAVEFSWNARDVLFQGLGEAKIEFLQDGEIDRHYDSVQPGYAERTLVVSSYCTS